MTPVHQYKKNMVPGAKIIDIGNNMAPLHYYWKKYDTIALLM